MLAERGGRLTERFGLVRFEFDLPSDSAGLRLIIRRWWLGPLPLPLFLAPRSEAREWEEEGRFRFEVAASLPLAGEIVRYSGWLVPVAPSSDPERRSVRRSVPGTNFQAVDFEGGREKSVPGTNY